MKCKAIAVAAALSVAAGAAMAAPWDHQQVSFTAIGGEANTLSNVAIFGAVGLFGVVGVDNTAYATVQNDQTALVWGTTLNAPSPWLSNFTSSTVVINNDYDRQSVSDTGSAHLNSTVSQTSFANNQSWIHANANGSLNTHQSFNTGGGYVAGHVDQGSGGFIAGGGGVFIPIGFGGVGIFGGGYAYGNESSSAGGFLAGGFKNTHDSFNSNFNASLDTGHNDTSYDSIHARSDWGFNNTSTYSNFSIDGTTIIHTTTYQMPEMNAGIGNGALNHASGNVGVNIAVGVDNVQANNVALSAMNAGPVYGAAQVFSNQSATGYGNIDGFAVNATVGDGALAHASGNVGVNIASGLGNVQANNLAAAVTTVKSHGGGSVVATAQNDQLAMMNTSDGNFVPTASLGSGALSYASGNIGVNLAAGLGNVQNNSLAISSVSQMK